MLDISEQYKELTEKLLEVLPLKAYPIRELLPLFRDDGHPITLKTELTITSVHNSGDISGIMCIVETEDGYSLACALTFLIFKSSTMMYSEITEYQRKREKRVIQFLKKRQR